MHVLYLHGATLQCLRHLDVGSVDPIRQPRDQFLLAHHELNVVVRLAVSSATHLWMRRRASDMFWAVLVPLLATAAECVLGHCQYKHGSDEEQQQSEQHDDGDRCSRAPVGEQVMAAPTDALTAIRTEHLAVNASGAPSRRFIARAPQIHSVNIRHRRCSRQARRACRTRAPRSRRGQHRRAAP